MGTIRSKTTARPSPTLEDVARLAGVSTATVSNVLANRKPVGSDARRRVEASIARLNYRPNPVAQSLMGVRTQIAGMLVPDIGNPYYAELMQAVERELGARGYAVLVGDSQDSASHQANYMQLFRDRRVDGLIVVVASDTRPAALESIVRGMPAVLAVRSMEGWTGDEVLGDQLSGMDLAIDYLVQLGHRRIAMINGDRRISTARLRRDGFERAFKARGLEPVVVSEGSFSAESGFAQANRILDMPDSPTAICAGNDILAMAVIAAATERGLRVPADLSVIGYDDIPYARLVPPGLTTVRQSATLIGTEAAKLFLESFDSGRKEPRSVVIRPELVIRRSTAPATK